ncbi:unnamed protein product [Cuscuta campestris]|uniref:Uncharacterized protein n=1 Tax=Cuscuta campestris TaxID=132261 RepID=A0A484KNR6_9ASTE|nr:unnamed protein product [Cuscuta campestris]
MNRGRLSLEDLSQVSGCKRQVRLRGASTVIPGAKKPSTGVVAERHYAAATVGVPATVFYPHGRCNVSIEAIRPRKTPISTQFRSWHSHRWNLVIFALQTNRLCSDSLPPLLRFAAADAQTRRRRYSDLLPTTARTSATFEVEEVEVGSATYSRLPLIPLEEEEDKHGGATRLAKKKEKRKDRGNCAEGGKRYHPIFPWKCLSGGMC